MKIYQKKIAVMLTIAIALVTLMVNGRMIFAEPGGANDDGTEVFPTELRPELLTTEPETEIPMVTEPETEEPTTVEVTEPETEEPTTVAVTEPGTEELTTVAVTEPETEEPTTVAVTEPETEELTTVAVTEPETEEPTTVEVTELETESLTEESTTEEIATEELPVEGYAIVETTTKVEKTSTTSPKTGNDGIVYVMLVAFASAGGILTLRRKAL